MDAQRAASECSCAQGWLLCQPGSCSVPRALHRAVSSGLSCEQHKEGNAADCVQVQQTQRTIIMAAVGEQEAHACQKLLQLALPTVGPRLQAHGHVGAVPHRVVQVPVPQEREPEVIDDPAAAQQLMTTAKTTAQLKLAICPPLHALSKGGESELESKCSGSAVHPHLCKLATKPARSLRAS